MTRREEAIDKAAIAYGNVRADDKRVVMGAAIAVYESHMRPEVTSVIDLDEMPFGSIVKGYDGFLHVRLASERKGWVIVTSGMKASLHDASAVELPARVIHRGQP